MELRCWDLANDPPRSPILTQRDGNLLRYRHTAILSDTTDGLQSWGTDARRAAAHEEFDVVVLHMRSPRLRRNASTWPHFELAIVLTHVLDQR